MGFCLTTIFHIYLVTLKPCETYDLQTIQSPQDCQHVANSTEALQVREYCITVWIKWIEQVRKHASMYDFVGVHKGLSKVAE